MFILAYLCCLAVFNIFYRYVKKSAFYQFLTQNGAIFEEKASFNKKIFNDAIFKIKLSNADENLYAPAIGGQNAV